MLLVLYREYVARMKDPPFIAHHTLCYREWLDMLQYWSEQGEYETLGAFIREAIDPTYEGI